MGVLFYTFQMRDANNEPVYNMVYIFQKTVNFFQATMLEKHSFSLDAITKFIRNVNECLPEEETKLEYGVFAMVVDHQAPVTLSMRPSRKMFGETIFDIKQALPWAKGSGKKSVVKNSRVKS